MLLTLVNSQILIHEKGLVWAMLFVQMESVHVCILFLLLSFNLFTPFEF